MIRKHKKTLILTSIITLLPIPVYLLLGRRGISVLIPLIMLATQWFCVYFTTKDPKNQNQSPKAMPLVLWTIPILTNLFTAIDYALVKGMKFSIASVFCLIFGVMFIAIGNYLPKNRQNYTMGIKVSWAYTSEDNWNATHRFGGKVWVIGGIVIALAASLPGMWAFGVMLTATALLVVLPVLYSYLYYRRQVRRGDPLTPVQKLPAKHKKLTVVFIAALLIFVGVLMFTGDIEYRFEDSHFVIEADYYDDLVIHYDAIDSMEYRSESVEGIRAWGFGSARLLMGTFQNQEFGNYTRYTYTGANSAVVLTVEGTTLVISGENPEETQKLYEALIQRTGL